MAMLAPTLGPAVGGFITDRYSWHWLFLINVGPGILVALAVAPLAAFLEPRVDARLLSFAGYGLLAAGLLGNGFMNPGTDFWGLFWQQIARGAAVMLCLLPSTALALDALPPAHVPNASGVFNLMRNLGGAIGLALIDTIIERRAPEHVRAFVARLQAGDPAAARFVGLPTDRFTGVPLAHIDRATRDFVAPLVRRAAFTAAIDDAWIFIGGLVLLSLLLLPLMRRTPPRGPQQAP